ncbi:unnamed protein product [Amoebophrya sp. A25]|nr:unnamed protein product [Amoebophrya sp. A25]|eukprot:GSA25T00014095001.1
MSPLQICHFAQIAVFIGLYFLATVQNPDELWLRRGTVGHRWGIPSLHATTDEAEQVASGKGRNVVQEVESGGGAGYEGSDRTARPTDSPPTLSLFLQISRRGAGKRNLSLHLPLYDFKSITRAQTVASGTNFQPVQRPEHPARTKEQILN